MRSVLSLVLLGENETRDTAVSFRKWVPGFTTRVFHSGVANIYIYVFFLGSYIGYVEFPILFGILKISFPIVTAKTDYRFLIYTSKYIEKMPFF